MVYRPVGCSALSLVSCHLEHNFHRLRSEKKTMSQLQLGKLVYATRVMFRRTLLDTLNRCTSHLEVALQLQDTLQHTLPYTHMVTRHANNAFDAFVSLVFHPQTEHGCLSKKRHTQPACAVTLEQQKGITKWRFPDRTSALCFRPPRFTAFE